MLRASLGRLLKHLAAMGTIYETGPNEYVPTALSNALKEPIYRDAYPTMFVLPVFRAILLSIQDLIVLLGLIFAAPLSLHFQNTSPKANTKTLTTLSMAHSNLAMPQRIISSSGYLSVRNV